MSKKEIPKKNDGNDGCPSGFSPTQRLTRAFWTHGPGSKEFAAASDDYSKAEESHQQRSDFGTSDRQPD